MRRETLFISDLHLDPDRPALTGLFFDFLAEYATAAEAVYILGDLFDAWIGDDDDGALGNEVTQAIRKVTESGTPVFLMHGNRDFLIGETFARRSGCTLIDDPLRIDLYGTPTLLLHGDSLCIDDHDYQRFREQVRAPDWQNEFLAQPLQRRREIVADLRRRSREETARKRADILDVNTAEVERVMRAYGVSQMIHGHTHRPDIHDHFIEGEPAVRIVLGDWGERGSVLRVSRNGCMLESI